MYIYNITIDTCIQYTNSNPAWNRVRHQWPSHLCILQYMQKVPKTNVCYSVFKKINNENGAIDWNMKSIAGGYMRLFLRISGLETWHNGG